MDWSTGDYTKTYADTIYVPEPEHGTGVYLLDEAGRDSDPGVDSRIRAPIRPYGLEDRPGRFGRSASRPPHRPQREGFYTDGNIISNRAGGNSRRVFDVAWDERPQHFNPSSGPEAARLVPDPRVRPHGGGPAPSLAFPLISHSEAVVDPSRNPFPSAPSKECFGGRCCGNCGGGAELGLQLVKVILLVVILVLLAMTLMASARLARSLEKTVKEAVGALSEVARAK